MTIIEKKDGVIEIISTHHIVPGSLKRSSLNPNNVVIKVFPFKNMFIITQGYKRDHDLIKHLTPYTGEISLEKIIKFSKILRKYFKNYGRLDKDKEFVSYFFIGDANRVFKIGYKGEVEEINQPFSSRNQDLYYSLIDLNSHQSFLKRNDYYLYLVTQVTSLGLDAYTYFSTKDFTLKTMMRNSR